MATTNANINTDIAHFKHFMNRINFIRGFTKHIKQYVVMKLLEKGCLQVSTCFEHALAGAGNHKVVSVDSNDLWHAIHGPSEAKLCTVVKSEKRTRVGNIKGKKGPLRVQIWEPQKNKFYYLVIPEDKYSLYKSLSIAFKQDGSPNRVGIYWAYEVADFKELANKWP